MAESGKRNSRDSHGQRRGVKRFGGQFVGGGEIIVRQCGTKIYPGENTGIGRDYTIYAKVPGFVEFKDNKNKKFVHIRTVDK